MSDARNEKSPRTYVQNILRYAKAAEFSSIYNQLTVAWNNLALEFRRDIPEPTSATTLGQFLDQVDAKANIWFEMTRQQNRGQQHQVDKKALTLPKQPVPAAKSTSTTKSCLASFSAASPNHRRKLVRFAGVVEPAESSLWRQQRKNARQAKRRVLQSESNSTFATAGYGIPGE